MSDTGNRDIVQGAATVRSMPAGIRALIEQLQAATPGTDIGAILTRAVEAARPANATEALRRSSLVRRLARDGSMYRDLLCADIADRFPFEDLVRLPEVRELPRGAGYVLDEAVQRQFLAEWQRDSTAWTDWNRRIADYLEAQDPGNITERLYHLTLSDRARALELFTREFDRADERFDLAQCFSLLAVLESLSRTLEGPLAAARNLKQQRYNARALFAGAYYRTGTYFERSAPLDAFTELRRSTRNWVYHLHATGGMGKTMFLRWLVARYLVPAGIPCVTIDFDTVDAANVTADPWLLLIPIAEQLNQQFPRPYLSGTLTDLSDFAPRLRPSQSVATVDATFAQNALQSRVSSADEQSSHDELGAQQTRKLASGIRESGVKELVIVLDTLEGVTLTRRFSKLFEFLESLHAAAPPVHVILAGRYNIPDKLKTLPARLGDDDGHRMEEVADEVASVSLGHHLSRFTDDEAKQYLRSRGITDEDLIGAIVDKVREPSDQSDTAGSNPFKLALCAELTLGRDSITVEEIKAWPGADFAYLLERVIKRIPEQPLRWVVRYGALPRRLTLAYIEAVLLEPLKRALRGEAVDDRPKQYLPEGAKELREQDVWTPDDTANPTATVLWEDLRRYEGPLGWLSEAGTPAEPVVQFHSDVVDPMRELLSYQAVFQPLQEASIRYFERLAAEQPARWAEWMSEAIFHQFQLHGEAAADYWKRQLNTPQALADADARLTIAKEVLRREYADDERTPRVRATPAGPIVSVRTLAEAHFATADAIRAKDPASPDLQWHMALWTELKAQAGALPSDPAEAAAVEATALAQDGHYERARDVLLSALATAIDPEKRFRLEVDLAEILATLRDPAAAAHYREAIRLRPAVGSPNRTQGSLYLSLARWYATEGYHLAAQNAFSAAYNASSGGLQATVWLNQAWTLLQAGDYDGAAQLLEQGPNRSMRPAMPETDRLTAWLWLALGDPVRALESAAKSLESASVDHDRAYARDVLARVHGQLLQLTPAFTEWDHAIKLFRGLEPTPPNAIESCLIDQMALRSHVMRDFNETLRLSQTVASSPAMRDPEIRGRVLIEAVMGMAGSGSSGSRALGELMDQLRAPATPAWPAPLRARVLAAGFRVGVFEATDEALGDFLEVLEEVQPPSARLEAIQPLLDGEIVLTASPYWRQRLLALFPSADPKRRSYVIRSLQTGILHRVLGSNEMAARLLLAALGALVERRNVAGAVRAIANLRAAGVTDDERLFPGGVGSGAPQNFGEAVLAIERAQTACDAREYSKAAPLLESAAHALKDEPLRTQWHARVPELRAVIALAAHEHREAVNQASLAAQEYEALGDAAGLARVKAFRASAAAAAPAPPPRPASAPAMMPPPAPARAAGPVSPAPPAASAPPVVAPVRKIRVGDPKDLQRMPVNVAAEQLMQQGGSLLFLQDRLPPDDLAFLQHGGGDIALEIDPGLLADAPWEWLARDEAFVYRTRISSAAVAREAAGWIQRAFVRTGVGEGVVADGVFGPMTTAAMNRFAAREGLPATALPTRAMLAALRERARPADWQHEARLLVVHPLESGTFGEDAALGSRGGFDVESLYADWPGRIEFVASPDLDMLGYHVKDVRPHVIHFIAALNDRHGVAHLDYSRERGVGEEGITSSALRRILADLSSTPPFIILDIARPSSTWDAAAALIRRNQLAGELLYAHVSTGILATGLVQPWKLETLERDIVARLGRNPSMRELTRAVQGFPDQKPGDIHDRLAFRGTALFTTEPDLPCVPF